MSKYVSGSNMVLVFMFSMLIIINMLGLVYEFGCYGKDVVNLDTFKETVGWIKYYLGSIVFVFVWERVLNCFRSQDD